MFPAVPLHVVAEIVFKAKHCPERARCDMLGVCQAKCRDSRPAAPAPSPAPREAKR